MLTLRHLFIFCFAFVQTTFSQTVLFSEDFETGGNAFTLNTRELSGASGTSGNNYWIRNNTYTGGSGSVICLGFPFSYTIPNTPAQPSGITNPNSNYLHILSKSANSNGITCTSAMPADGLCTPDEYNFARMDSDISTIGMSSVSFTFWWICGGEATIYGELYYSTDGGQTWVLSTSKYNLQTTWAKATVTNPTFDNQATLRFAFRFVNTQASNPSDPAFAIDDISVTGTVATTCLNSFSTITPIVCNTYTSPSGKIWTSSNTYLDTIPNASGCDSIITVKLTVNNSTYSNLTISACDSYISPSGKIWTNSNTYTDTITNTAGCDSIITINLTINTSPSWVQISGSGQNNICMGDSVLLTAGGLSGWNWNTGETTKSIYVNNAGQYYVIIVDANNCHSDTSNIISMNLVYPSTVTFQFMMDTTCTNDFAFDLNLIANPTGGTFNGSGVVGNYFDPTVANLGWNYVQYVYTDSNSCSTAITDSIWVDACTTTLKTTLTNAKFHIYPNPSNGLVNVQSEKVLNSITVYNAIGVIVYQNKTNRNTQVIDLSSQTQGIYFIKANNQVLKLIKE